MEAPTALAIDDRVADALRRGAGVVALESSVFAQGLPQPVNADAARRMVAAVERAGAVPAITALVRGIPTVGMRDPDLQRFLAREGVVKVSARDLAPRMRSGADGATTVAATLVLAALAGVEVFATGGIGGVHRGAGHDESADLVELARTPMMVVCSGAKAILDLPATVERLETLGVTVVGYRTDRLPAFYSDATDIVLAVAVDTPEDLARMYLDHVTLRRPGAILVVQPPPSGAALPAREVEQAIAHGLDAAGREGITGAAVTPYLLAAVEKATEGRSVAANVALLESNAALAGQLAVAVAVARNNR